MLCNYNICLLREGGGKEKRAKERDLLLQGLESQEQFMFSKGSVRSLDLPPTGSEKLHSKCLILYRPHLTEVFCWVQILLELVWNSDVTVNPLWYSGRDFKATYQSILSLQSSVTWDVNAAYIYEIRTATDTGMRHRKRQPQCLSYVVRNKDFPRQR